MKNLLSRKLGTVFYDVPNEQITNRWLRTLEEAAYKNTLVEVYPKVLKDVLACQDDKTKWQGLSIFVMVLGDSKMWKELFAVIGYMRSFLKKRHLNPTRGLWNHSLHHLVYCFNIYSKEDLLIAKKLIRKVTFFAEDCHRLVEQIIDFDKRTALKIPKGNWRAKDRMYMAI